ncbi:hypothetical protein ABZ442_14915 [Streptomyces triculaminicus]|uniref:hypothetical protein n=1 Tax=Streptomyces triculaminicus TaxID=2816232 RepID=UPI0034078B96
MHSILAKSRILAVAMTTAFAVLLFSNSPASALEPGESTRWANEIEGNTPVQANGIMGEARAANGDLFQVWHGADNGNMYLSLNHSQPLTLPGQTHASPQIVFVGGQAQFLLFHTGSNGFVYYTTLSVAVGDNGHRYARFDNWRQVPNGARTLEGLSVAVTVTPNNGAYLAFRGYNSNEIWGMYYNSQNGHWDLPTRTFGATSDSAPALAYSTNNNHILLAYRGTDNQVNVIRLPYGSGNWYGRTILGGVLTDSHPAIGVAPSGTGQVAIRQQGTGVLHLQTITDSGAHINWVRESQSQTSPWGPRIVMDAYRAYLVATAWGGYVLWKQSRQF